MPAELLMRYMNLVGHSVGWTSAAMK